MTMVKGVIWLPPNGSINLGIKEVKGRQWRN